MAILLMTAMPTKKHGTLVRPRNHLPSSHSRHLYTQLDAMRGQFASALMHYYALYLLKSSLLLYTLDVL